MHKAIYIGRKTKTRPKILEQRHVRNTKSHQLWAYSTYRTRTNDVPQLISHQNQNMIWIELTAS